MENEGGKFAGQRTLHFSNSLDADPTLAISRRAWVDLGLVEFLSGPILKLQIRLFKFVHVRNSDSNSKITLLVIDQLRHIP